MKDIFEIDCKQLQSELLSNKSPLAIWNISLKDLQVKHCLLARVLALLYDNMLTIKSSSVRVNQIQGGLLPIVDICTHKEIFSNGIIDMAIYKALAQAECKYYGKTSMNECIIEKVNGLFKYIHPSNYRNTLIEIANSDSQWVVNTFNDLNFLTIKDIERSKVNYKVLWLCLFKIIRIYSLKVKITKVKAHSDCDYNKEADKLAKSGVEKNVLIIEDKLLLHSGTVC
ncbi:unnamed protein product [Rhizophagus irregularis]|nr:unnamed protein product [Rhizophagus irregularis]